MTSDNLEKRVLVNVLRVEKLKFYILIIEYFHSAQLNKLSRNSYFILSTYLWSGFKKTETKFYSLIFTDFAVRSVNPQIWQFQNIKIYINEISANRGPNLITENLCS